MEKELDIEMLIKHHTNAIETRKICLNTIEYTDNNTDKDASVIANFAIASRACLDLSEALEAILKNEGVIYAGGKYLKDITPKKRSSKIQPRNTEE